MNVITNSGLKFWTLNILSILTPHNDWIITHTMIEWFLCWRKTLNASSVELFDYHSNSALWTEKLFDFISLGAGRVYTYTLNENLHKNVVARSSVISNDWIRKEADKSSELIFLILFHVGIIYKVSKNRQHLDQLRKKKCYEICFIRCRCKKNHRFFVFDEQKFV